MMQQVRGTRTLVAEEASAMLYLQREFTGAMLEIGAEAILFPSLDFAARYSEDAGPEVWGQMYVFKDRKDRDLCLRPEVTASFRDLGKSGRLQDDQLYFYYERCWRYERPQAGRYREFTQFGVEWWKPQAPAADAIDRLEDIAMKLLLALGLRKPTFQLNHGVKRGLGLYTDDGFEIVAESLGAQKQILGGGVYDGGAGFAFGLDRLAMLIDERTP